jgi:hypothetical protein
MTLKYYKKIIIIFFILMPLIVNAVYLRGRIDGYNNYSRSYYPLSNAKVDLYMNTSQGWKKIAYYITGYNGTYYFQNIRSGNDYVIQVNGRINYPIKVFNRTHQDLPPILLKY